KWDLADARAAMPPTLRSIDAEVDDDSVAVSFAFNGTPQVRTFREDRSIVVDVGHDGAKPKSMPKPAAEEGAKPKQDAAAPAAVPAIEPPETMPATDAAAEPPPKAVPPPVEAAALLIAPAAVPPPLQATENSPALT